MNLAPVLVLAPLLAAAPAKPSAADLAAGALSYLVGHRCEKLPAPAGGTTTIEWPSVIYGKQAGWGAKPFNRCNGDTWTYTESVAAGAYWAQNDHEKITADPFHTPLFDSVLIHEAFKTQFGWELPEHNTESNGYQSNAFNKYTAKQVQGLFDAFYVKPTEKLGDLTAKDIYDVAFKNVITKLARQLAGVTGKVPKAKWPKLLKDYQTAANAPGPRFNGPEYLKQAASSVLPQGEDPATSGSPRALGIVLRRHADGTWPTVVKLLKKVLADYDPALAKEVGASLK